MPEKSRATMSKVRCHRSPANVSTLVLCTSVRWRRSRERARSNPKRVLFAEGEEPNVLRAAIAFRDGGYGTPVLVGRENVYDQLAELGVDDPQSFEVLNSRNSPLVGRAVDYIYSKHQRHGMLRREVERLLDRALATRSRRCLPCQPSSRCFFANADGRRLRAPTENVIVRGCNMKDGHGGVTIGSFSGGTGGSKSYSLPDAAIVTPRGGGFSAKLFSKVRLPGSSASMRGLIG